MKVKIKEYDEDGKTRKAWWAELGLTSGAPPLVCVDYPQKGTKTRHVAVYIPLKKILSMVANRLEEHTP